VHRDLPGLRRIATGDADRRRHTGGKRATSLQADGAQRPMSAVRYFIERRYGPKHYVPIGTQPSDGFASMTDAKDWLLERGAIRQRLSVETGEPYLEGWGGERGYYTRPVLQGRRPRAWYERAIDRLKEGRRWINSARRA
jgi:hypothetical protein